SDRSRRGHEEKTMELQIAVDELSRALYRSQGIAEKKSTLPLLSHVLLEAKDGKLTVTAFDLEIGLVSEHRAEVSKEGRIAVSARRLFDIVRMLPEPTAVLRLKPNNYLEITCGSSRFRIVGADPEDYPRLPISDVPFVAIQPKLLLEMLELTSIAVSTDETRLNLNGVFFQPVEGGLRLVATDGHRLSMAERKMEGRFDVGRGVILPRKGVAELRKLLGEGEAESAELGLGERICVFRRPGLTFVMQLVAGQFPEYEKVIPERHPNPLVLRRVGFLDTLKRVSLLSQDQMHTVKLEVGDGVLKVTSQSPELGEAYEEIPVETRLEPLRVGFNARYLIDVLGVMDAEEVRFELSDELSPGVIRPLEDDSYTAVVMPVRI
ncbi:MAG TPA: DNA polymerase III subunit beta, partial [Fredinandcohnia sp.]|nr:DNA polymerase III subunit beta [Fredinandcohnia sp.]